MVYILGRKIGMTQITTEDGRLVPVTLIEATPNTVYQVKTTEKDGYRAIAVSYTPKNSKKKKIREFRVESTDGVERGQNISVEMFADTDSVSIQGLTKGKGFQGTIKRHNFTRQGQTHGVKGHRIPGSIGACASPGRVFKGQNMPGQMGYKQVTIAKVPLVKIEAAKNLLAVKGPVPGAYNTLLKVWSN